MTDDELPDAVFNDLFSTIESRRETLPDDSYTTSLLTHDKGENAALEKLGEEATETILAAKDGDSAAIQAESADLIYHLFVVLAMEEITLDDLREELLDRS
ncbi:phosphoribosyl-ATP diphosphatase [Haloquadratum walsbyi]|jgi:phosphoribosyl-ATP pyrophosphatase (EC 3.6.1.31)|uniref:Phosphoribosyl-ATP pyrophosphatase n=1 Tax=Haloquadratum walsbyi J07HQW2 TaxID=1238425 RepID=U1PRD2_9EURY|nr:phosphoribosyl-ATP diphosphatase [Haloquadratum walsbyi]ERG96327.1 MAG: phosphoribosyl-ATP pyrophosphohydrolase [Haloquadratum walsbyi J07HQW2]